MRVEVGAAMREITVVLALACAGLLLAALAAFAPWYPGSAPASSGTIVDLRPSEAPGMAG